MQCIGEGANKKVYKMDEERVLKIFKNSIDTQNLRNVRLEAEKDFGSYLPRLYWFTQNGIVEQYCGKTIASPELGLKNRIDWLVFLVRTKLMHNRVDPNPANFTRKDGKLKYVDWDERGSGRSLSFCIDIGYNFVFYEAIKILERNEFFRKIQNC